jgi:hypothetical protein
MANSRTIVHYIPRTRRWTPDGVTPYVRKDLPAAAKRHIANVLARYDVPPADIRVVLDAISLAVSLYRGAKAYQQTCTPSHVRRRLERLRNTAMKLNEQFNALDDVSRQLLQEYADDLSYNGLAAQILPIITAASSAYEAAGSFPNTALPDYARRELAVRVADIIEHCLHTAPTSTRNGLYIDLLGATVEAAIGKPPRECQKLARAALAELKARRADGDYFPFQFRPPK